MTSIRFIASVLTVVGCIALGQQPTRGQASAGVHATLRSAPDRTLAPEFALEDSAGKIGRLSEYRGRVVLLDFWATTCGGCVKEIPDFIDIAQAYERRGLTTLGVSEDIVYENLSGAEEAWGRVRPFVRDHKIGYRILMGDSRVTAAYDINALPLTYLIDRKGRVAATYSGMVDRANLEANITRLLGDPR